MADPAKFNGTPHNGDSCSERCAYVGAFEVQPRASFAEALQP